MKRRDRAFNAPFSTIMETNKYEMFTMYHINRNVDKINRLEKSMLEIGFSPAFPIIVVEGEMGLLVIKFGHHRFITAKKINIPVKYVVCDQSEIPSIFNAEDTTRPWNLNDFHTAHMKYGNKANHIVEDYHTRTGIPIGCCVSLLSGESPSSGNYARRFKTGKYKPSCVAFANDFADIVIELKNLGFDFASTSTFVTALFKAICVKGFQVKHFLKNISRYQHLLQRQPNVDRNLEAMEAAYNHGSKNKIPLRFLAMELSRQRSATNLSPQKKKAVNGGNHNGFNNDFRANLKEYVSEITT